jgi:hypothetical protein
MSALHSFETTFCFPFSPDSVALLKLKWPMQESDMDLLIETLTLWKKTLCVPNTPDVQIEVKPNE